MIYFVYSEIEKRFDYIGGGSSGNKKITKRFQRIYKDIYRYYGVSNDDIKNKTERYEKVVRVLSLWTGFGDEWVKQRENRYTSFENDYNSIKDSRKWWRVVCLKLILITNYLLQYYFLFLRCNVFLYWKRVLIFLKIILILMLYLYLMISLFMAS